MMRNNHRLFVLVMVTLTCPLTASAQAPGLDGVDHQTGGFGFQHQVSVSELYAQSYKYEREGAFAKAVEAALQAHQRGETVDACLRLGWLYYQSGDHESSLKFYQAALKISPMSADARLGVMLPLIGLERFEEAEPYGKGLLTDDPENLYANKSMALVEYMLGDYERAERMYRKVVEAEPDDAEMKLGLGLALVGSGRYEEGKTQCRAIEEQLRDDARLEFCLKQAARSWVVRPQVYGTGGFYSDPWDKQYFAGGMFVLEVTTPSKFGFQFDFSYSWNGLEYTASDFHQYAPGGAVFYLFEKGIAWAHYALLYGNDKTQGTGHVVSLYGDYTTDLNIKLGSSVDVGIYSGFQTFQLAPVLGYVFGDYLTVSVVPMLQMSRGKISRSDGERGKGVSVRGSVSLEFDITVPYAQFELSGFYGSRWFTVENRGLWVWNSDDEIIAGARASLTLFPGEIVSANLAFRFDRAEKQFGLDHKFEIYGFMAGLVGTF